MSTLYTHRPAFPPTYADGGSLRIHGCPAYSLVKVKTRDADEHAASLSQWDQTYEQLTPGQFEGSVLDAWFDGIQVFREITSQTIHEAGVPWKGSRTIGVPVSMEGSGYFCGETMQENSMITLGGGDELDFRAPRKLDIVAVVVDTKLLTSYSCQIEERNIDAELADKRIAPASPKQVECLRHFLLTVLNTLDSDASPLKHYQARKSLQNAILALLHTAIGGAEKQAGSPAPSLSRRRTVGRAKEYMLAHIDEPQTVADLCMAIGVSRRALQYSFEEILDINPKSYLRAIRLNGVRRELRRGNPNDISVQDVAARWGFWHMSRLSADYKRMFGEMPSETLRKQGARAVG